MKRKRTEESSGKSLTNEHFEEIEFEVEYILGHQVESRECFYHIKWLGYSWEHCTWEPEKNLSCPDIVSLYKQMIGSEAAKSHFAVLSDSQISHLKSASAKKSNSQKAQLRAFEGKINLAAKGREGRIFVENTVDSALPDEDFVYITKCKAGDGVVIHSDPLVGCECMSCGISSACCHTHGNTLYAYDKSGHLRLAPGVVIYECNVHCKCSSAPNEVRPYRCRNRNVQRGRRIPVTIFRTSNGRGWGLRTNSLIAKGRFVTEYVGEVITVEEANTSRSSDYLMDLDFTEDCVAKYVIDAGVYGNVSHFINHSCDPNLVVHGVIINNPDISMPQIALFAKREIKAGEELTFDYNASLLTGKKAQSPLSSPNHALFSSPKKKDCSSLVDSHFPRHILDDSDCAGALPAIDFSVCQPTAGCKDTVTHASSVHCPHKLLPGSLKSEERRSSQTGSTSFLFTPDSKSSSLLSQQLTPISSSDETATPIRKRQLCLCGAEQCRGYIY